ncbi:MAG TPA: hypothetical protein VMF55_13250, partial [Solirubrobacterales bacterium]|nr:hypothetical protein [Solirubrobacterales bacterium]
MRPTRRVLLAALALAVAAGAPAAAVAAKPIGIAERFHTKCWVHGIAIAPGGGAWFGCVEYSVNEPARAKVGRVTANGKVTEFSGPFPKKSGPGPVATAADGNFWVVIETAGETQLARVTPTGEVKLFPLPSGSGYIAELVAAPSDYLWFATAEGFEDKNPAIWQISPTGAISKTAVPLSSGKLPGLTIGADGNLWFADGGEGIQAPLSRLTPSGELTQPADQSPGFGARRPTKPAASLVGGAALGAEGNLFYGLQSDRQSAIGRLAPTGTTTEFSDCLTYGQPYFGPETLALGAEGNLWFTSLAERSTPNISDPPSIGMITPSGQITQIFAGISLEPKWIATGPEGGAWFSGGFDEIQRIKPPQGKVNTFHVGKLTGVRRNGSALLPVKVPSAGRLKVKPVALLVGKKERKVPISGPTAKAKASACGTPQVRLKLSGEALRRLRQKNQVLERVAVTFTPTGGTPYTEEAKLHF